MKTLLLFPPHCLPNQPWCSLPALTAFLKGHGFEVRQRDLNIEIYHHLLSRRYLERVASRLEDGLASLETKPALTPSEQEKLLKMVRARGLLDTIVDGIEEAKQTFQNADGFYSFRRLERARSLLRAAFETISAAHYPGKLSHEDFVVWGAYDDVDTLKVYTEDRATNPFIEIFEEDAIPEAKREQPSVIGVSISLQEQILPGLTLSRMLRRSLPDTPIILGGYLLTKVADRLRSYPDFFDTFADYVALGEGEKTLLGLVEALASGRDPRTVPGLLFADGDAVGSSGRFEPLDGEELPTPDYAGFPLELYLSPVPILSLAASRGCYWGRCAFCDRGHDSGIRYRPRPAKQVVDELEFYSKKHGTRHFSFTDEAIAPKLLRQISEEITRRKLDLRLSADARFEKSLTEEICRKMGEAGFVHVRFGLESASDRVLQRMRKGTDTATIEEILRFVAAEEICAHLYVFFGFPTEAAGEADATIGFVVRNKDLISTACATTYGLVDQSPAFNCPTEFGIESIDPKPSSLFKYFFDFECSQGMSQAAAKEKEKLFFETMAQEFDEYDVLGNLEWGHGFLYCANFGFKGIDRLPTETPTASLSRVPAESVPRLKKGTLYYECPFDLAEIAENLRTGRSEEVAPDHSHILFDCDSGRLASINSDAAAALDLVDGVRSVGQIAERLAGRYGDSPRRLEVATQSFFRSMQGLGVEIGPP